MRAAFARFDANRSGKLDHRELRAALRQLGLDVDEHEATAMLQRHDTNNNGLLDVREFGALVRQLGRRGTLDLDRHAAGAAWQTARSDDGREYFYNDETGESTWTRPAALDAKPRATPRRTADEPPLSPATVPRALPHRPAPPPCPARGRRTHVSRPATRPIPATRHAARHPPRATVALQHAHRGALLSNTQRAPAQVLLAVNSVSEAGRQRALAVSGLEMASTHGASRSVRGGPGAGRSGVRSGPRCGQ